MSASGSFNRVWVSRYASALRVVCAVLVFIASGRMGNAGVADSEARNSVRTLRNSEGELVDPFSNSNGVATVFVFVRPDCPISNRYSPELKRIRTRFAERRIV